MFSERVPIVSFDRDIRRQRVDRSHFDVPFKITYYYVIDASPFPSVSSQ